MQCNCENSHCLHDQQGIRCPNAADPNLVVDDIGPVCGACAALYRKGGYLKESVDGMKGIIAAAMDGNPTRVSEIVDAELDRRVGVAFAEVKGEVERREASSLNEESPFDLNQLAVLKDTVRNPLKGKFLGGPSAEEAEEILRTKYGWTDERIARLKESKEDEDVECPDCGHQGKLSDWTDTRTPDHMKYCPKCQSEAEPDYPEVVKESFWGPGATEDTEESLVECPKCGHIGDWDDFEGKDRRRRTCPKCGSHQEPDDYSWMEGGEGQNHLKMLQRGKKGLDASNADACDCPRAGVNAKDCAKCRGTLKESAGDLNGLLRDYLETALWSETDNADDSGGEPLDTNYSVGDFAPGEIDKARRDCHDFLHKARAFMARHPKQNFGHDFCLTRNGHGAGFWDGDYGDDGAALTKIAESFGEVHIYVGDNGKLYFGP
jgi:hypothetical protein